MAAPRDEDVQAVLERSQRRWQSDLHYAKSRCGFAHSIANPTSLIRNVPAMPSNHKLEQFPNGSLLEVRGRATWKYQVNANCSLSESTASNELTIGVTVPTKFTVVGNGFHDWEETFDTKGKSDSKSGNHLAILLPCWAYILSSFLVETQGCLMEYTSISAPSMHDSIDSMFIGHGVYVGNADLKEVRWWKAILASGQGWRSIIRISSDVIYLAPWSIEYRGDPQFFIKTSTAILCAGGTQDWSPPSSEEALQYLTSYCILHDLEIQYFAALSAALILPLQNLLGREVQLPKPVMAQSSRKLRPLPDAQKQFLDLPHLVTLSCAIQVVSSALWTVFWEPEIDCNLASAWLSPVSKMVNSLIETNDHETLIRMLARHRPTVGPLWLGAILVGLSRDIPGFFRTSEAPYARPDSLASAWLELPQLFMDTPGIGAYKCDGNRIRRADRWRLLHDVGLQPYFNTPLSPWQPFGWMPLAAVEIDVMAHADCKRHEKQYIRWNWLGLHGTDMLGIQRISSNSIIDRTRLLLTRWAAAICYKLTWLTVKGIDRQKRGRSIDNHLWVKGLILCGFQKSGAGEISIATESIEDSDHLEPDYDVQASIAATRSIFAWLTVGGEGWGESEGPIYEHPWMAELIPTDTDESTSDGLSEELIPTDTDESASDGCREGKSYSD